VAALSLMFKMLKCWKVPERKANRVRTGRPECQAWSGDSQRRQLRRARKVHVAERSK